MNMKRRRLHFENIRALPLRVILEEWQKEVDFPGDVMERELRMAVLNLDRDWQNGDLIDPLFPDDELPGMDTLVDKDWLTDFCGKGDWPFPKFWFPRGMEDIKLGRPSHMPAIVQELERRAEAGELADTVTQEARELNDWAVGRGLGYPRLNDKSIRNRIGARYRELKERH